MISNEKTALALIDKLKAWNSLNGDYDIAYQSDKKYEPTPSVAYIKESFLANDNEYLGLGYNSCVKQLPIYQLDVMTPKGQGGKWDGLSIVDKLVVEFKRAPIFFNDGEQSVQIESVSGSNRQANDTHNWTMISINLIVLAKST